MKHILLTIAALIAAQGPSAAQDVQSAPPLPLVQLQAPPGAPLVLTLTDALQRAKQNDAQFQSSVADADLARQDRVQAKAGLLPAFSHTTQYLGNQPNG